MLLEMYIFTKSVYYRFVLLTFSWPLCTSYCSDHPGEQLHLHKEPEGHWYWKWMGGPLCSVCCLCQGEWVGSREGETKRQRESFSFNLFSLQYAYMNKLINKSSLEIANVMYSVCKGIL